MKKLFDKFWSWYEKHYAFNVGLAAFLFLWQLVHLYWLTAHVVAHEFLGKGFFELTGIWSVLIVIVDYTEIPALITTSLVYINENRKKARFKNVLYLFLINVQWLHLFWLTDEYVVEYFSSGHVSALPMWLALTAIFIDYLELPVIYETVKKSLGLFVRPVSSQNRPNSTGQISQ